MTQEQITYAKELIKEMDEHIKEAGGMYGLELCDEQLKFIKAALRGCIGSDVRMEETPMELYRCPGSRMPYDGRAM